MSGTGNSATVVIEANIPVFFEGAPLQPGDEIAVFTSDDVCAGTLGWDTGGNQAITVWADNPITSEVDGFTEGGEMYYRVWSEQFEMEVGGTLGVVEVDYDTCGSRPPLCSPQGDYQSGAIFYLSMLEAYLITTEEESALVTGEEHVSISAYPNPFSERSNVSVIVPRSSSVTIDLVDQAGRVVQKLYGGEMEAGVPNLVEFEPQRLSQGVYFVRVLGENFSSALAVTHLD